ncbi:hypothetical protein JST97_12295 [bacterium]|nr:hypothetical protein [bacterium]
MEELVKQISAKTGLPEAQARQAAETAVAFIKAKLPEPMQKQFDTLLSGGGSQLGGMLGGLMG